MHYKNGREAKNGDAIVLVSKYGDYPKAGVLYGAVVGNDHCNGRIAITSPSDPIADLSQCLHVDDIKAATIPDSTK